jgi:Bacterial SH3 domain
MTRPIWSAARYAIAAAAFTAVSAVSADATPASLNTNTNLRQGPGTQFGVITTVPAGTLVNVIRCGGAWCNVTVNGQPGYMIARSLSGAAPVPVGAAPAPVVVAPPPVYYGYGPYYGPRLYYGPGFYYGPRRYWRRW